MSTTRGTLRQERLKRIPAFFFRTEAGTEPVRSWLRAMVQDDRRMIGEDIKAVEFGWPVGMPTCKPLGSGLHEVRTNLPGIELLAFSSMSMGIRGWFSCMGSSRRPGRHRRRIWILRD